MAPPLRAITAGISSSDEALICRFDLSFYPGDGFTGDLNKLWADLKDAQEHSGPSTAGPVPFVTPPSTLVGADRRALQCHSLAPLRPDRAGCPRSVLEAKRTSRLRARTSEFDPFETWQASAEPSTVAIDNRPIRLKHYLHRRDLPARPTNVCSLGNDVTQSRDARLSPRHFSAQVIQPQ